MSDWHEEEAKAECLDLRIKVRELEAQMAELKQAVSLHWEQKLDAHVESADRRLWALIDKGEL